MKTIPRLADQPAGTTVAGLLARYLDQGDAAARHLRRGSDDEALHDLRIALRRIRALLGAYGDWLKVPDKKAKGHIARLARRTSLARDGEILRAWLATMPPDLTHTATFADILALLDQAACNHGETGAKAIHARYQKLAANLRRARPARTDRKTRFGTTAGFQIQKALARFAHRLTQLQQQPSPETAHNARIAGKSVRYLVEPFTRADLQWREHGQRLARYQTLLGDIQDCAAMRELLADIAEKLCARQGREIFQSGTPNPEPCPVLRELAARLDAARQGAWQTLGNALEDDSLAVTLKSIAELAFALDGGNGEAQQEWAKNEKSHLPAASQAPVFTG